MINVTLLIASRVDIKEKEKKRKRKRKKRELERNIHRVSYPTITQ